MERNETQTESQHSTPALPVQEQLPTVYPPAASTDSNPTVQATDYVTIPLEGITIPVDGR